jgi:hypothetical protein
VKGHTSLPSSGVWFSLCPFQMLISHLFTPFTLQQRQNEIVAIQITLQPRATGRCTLIRWWWWLTI